MIVVVDHVSDENSLQILLVHFDGQSEEENLGAQAEDLIETSEGEDLNENM